MNKNFFLILILLFLCITSKQIIFPFTTKTYGYESNNEFKYIFENEIFTTLEVGTPKQKVELFLTAQTPFFIIKKNSTIKSYYNNETSSSYKHYDNSSIYYFGDDILKRGIQSSEKIILQNSFGPEQPVSVSDLDFIYSTAYEKDNENHMGLIGLQFISTSFVFSKEINMMVTLKKKGLTSNYIWNLNYTDDNSGFLIIGDYPHNYAPNKYNKDNLRQINVHREGAQKLIWNLYFNEVKYGEFDLSGHKTGKFTPQYGVLIGPNIFDSIITKEFFQNFIDNGKCERKTYDEFDYFVCDENIDLSNFKNLEFTEKEISTEKFIFTKDDLFLKKNGKLFFLVAFGHNWEYNYCWNLGKPFMKKYNFLFDEDGKQILMYEKEDEEENKKNLIGNKNFVYFIWGGIVVLVIIIGVLIFVLTKIIKKKRKKLYELEDDFYYNSEENNNNEESKRNDNENKNEKIFKFEGDENENKFGL